MVDLVQMLTQLVDHGGNGHATNNFSVAGGGAGNPGGISYTEYNGSYTYRGRGETGTGGLLIVMSNTIINNKVMSSNGRNGHSGGGSSGGGSINLFYKNNIQRGTITVNGGSQIPGGAGGAGSITSGNISTGTFIKD